MQTVLLAIFRAASTSRSLSELLATTHRQFARLMDTSNFYVALYDQESDLYSFPFHVDEYEADDQPPRRLSGSLTDYVRRTGNPLFADERVHERLSRQGHVELVGVPSPVWLGVPLEVDREVFGVVAVQSYRDRSVYSRDDLEVLSFLAENIALAVERLQAEEKLHSSEKRFRDLFEASPDGIFVEDLEGKVLDVNPAGCRLQRIERDRLIGMNVAELVPEDNIAEAMESFGRLASGEVDQVEGFTLTGDGASIPVEVRSKPIEYAGQPAVLVQVRDITQRKERERRLEYLARFDALTGLPNRFLFEDRLQQAVAAARRAGQRFALLYLDLDEFKTVNDTLGHAVGDELLKAAAHRLLREVREADSVARLGGDEFAIIQQEASGAAAASAFAIRLIEAMARPFDLGDHRIHTSTSVGISMFSADDQSTDLLLQADRALYKAKERGRSSFQFHDEDLAQEVERYVTLRQDLYGAVERGEFFLEYQPQIDLATGAIVGSEALVRWRHPRRGLLYPNAFITVTETTGLIVPLGRWVLAEICRQRKEWCDLGLPAVAVAVNLSAVQFRDPAFAKKLHSLLEGSGLDPCLLELELTESVLMHGSDEVRTALASLSERGISIAVDDFGTGYSSLRYLREFPIQKLKIAMEFVQGVSEDVDDAAIVEAVVSLGHKLGMRVIAEGVETEEQVRFLRGCVCDQAQGFYFGRPMAPAAFAALLERQAEGGLATARPSSS